jgi:fructokinase
VDTVGAGDAFTAALLAGLADVDLLSTQTLAECATSGGDVLHRIADQAMAAAALTCALLGADPRHAVALAFQADPRSSG